MSIKDLSANTLTPKGTDRILVVDADEKGGHELLSSIKDFVNSDVYNKTEVDTKISAEATARENAISAETTARQSAISAEQTARENAITAEATARENADTTLQTAINTKANNDDVYTKAQVDSKDSALSSRLSVLESAVKNKWWGLDMNENTGAFTRIGSDVSKMTFTPAPTSASEDGPVKVTSGFDNLYPWCAIRQCKMDDNGNILAYSDDSYYDSVDGDYMTELPLTYYAEFKVMVDGVKHHVIAISGSDDAGSELNALYGEAIEGSKSFAPEKIFVTPKGNVVQHAYIARLMADSTYHSKPDTEPVNNSGVDIRTNTASKGDGKWCSYDAMMRTFLVHLMAIEAGKFDVKNTYGQGVNDTNFSWSKANPITVAVENQSYIIVSNATANKFNVGLDVFVATSYSGKTYSGTITAIETYDDDNKKITLDCEPFTTTTEHDIHAMNQRVTSSMVDSFNGGSGWYKRGARPNTKSNVCYRGIWDLWGNLYQWVDGFMSGGTASDYLYLCFDQSKYKNANSSPVGADGWINTQKCIMLENGYQKTVGLQNGIHIPESLGGGSTTYIGAFAYYFGAGSYWHTGVRLLVGGGYFNRGGAVSPLCVRGDCSPSGRNIDIASRFIRQNLGV